VKKLAKIFVDFFIKKVYNYYRNKKEIEKNFLKISKKSVDILIRCAIIRM
jgi:hypothetical protein